MKNLKILNFIFVIGNAGLTPIHPVSPETNSIYTKFAEIEKKRILILYTLKNVLETHTQFFDLLTEKGFENREKILLDDGLILSENGYNLYDHIIIFDSGKNITGLDTIHNIMLEFVDAGGNLFLASSPASKNFRLFVNHISIDYDKNDFFVKDYFQESSDASLLKTSNVAQNTPIISDPINSVLFRGIGHMANLNGLVFPILRGTATSISSDPISASGEQILLVSGHQSLNAARAVVSGSIEMYSDAFIHQNPDNKLFASNVIDWNFHRKGLLRTSNLKHHKEGHFYNGIYTVGDHIRFSLDIHELKNGYWTPFKANDIQVEYTMKDPVLRTFLEQENPESPTFTTVIRAPDQWGIYKFAVHYTRLGYNAIHLESLAPARTLKHDDYDRFLPNAFPYYTVPISCLLGLFLFTLIFLYDKEPFQSANKLKTH